MQAERALRVFVVDDQILVRAAFCCLLDQQNGFEIAGQSGSARDAIEQVGRLQPDVVLLDIAMPGLSGMDAIPLIRKASPSARILMLTHHEGEFFVDQALRAGAHGYLSKDSDPMELPLAIRSVLGGGAYLTPRVVSGTISRAQREGEEPAPVRGALEALTPREREVFQQLALGKSNKEIATELSMKLGTVKKHRENLQRKLDCHSTAGLSRLAIREGLLDP